MVLGFAGRAFTVMALDTVAGDEGVVECKGFPVLDGVTLVAAVGGGRVRSGLADRHFVVMAADAGFRGIGQDAVQMAAFATQFPMGAVQCKSGRAVIEVGEGARDSLLILGPEAGPQHDEADQKQDLKTPCHGDGQPGGLGPSLDANGACAIRVTHKATPVPLEYRLEDQIAFETCSTACSRETGGQRGRRIAQR